MRCIAALTLLLLLPLSAIAAEEATVDDLLEQAQIQYRLGKTDEAIALADRAIEKDPQHLGARVLRAALFEAAGEYDKAVDDLTKAVTLKPDAPGLYQRRGVAHFKAGKFKASVADFDAYLKANPADEPHHWQRGISHYYAGMYKEGVAQFELHRTVNPEDVENAIWHYLCKAKVGGVEAARKALIPIKDDGRSWAGKAFDMFRGELTPAQYLREMEALGGREAEKSNRLFYTHLYIGLFHEAAGDADKAKQHITIAAEKYPSKHYMGDVARVHAAVFNKKQDAPE